MRIIRISVFVLLLSRFAMATSAPCAVAALQFGVASRQVGILDDPLNERAPSDQLILSRVTKVVQTKYSGILSDGFVLGTSSKSPKATRIILRDSHHESLKIVTVVPVLTVIDGDVILKGEESIGFYSVGNTLIETGWHDHTNSSRIYFFEGEELSRVDKWSDFIFNQTPESEVSFNRVMSPKELEAWKNRDLHKLLENKNYQAIIYTEFRHEDYLPGDNRVRFKIPKAVLLKWSKADLLSAGTVGMTSRNPDHMTIEVNFKAEVWRELFPFMVGSNKN